MSVNNISLIIIIVDLFVVSDHRSNDTINLFSAVANLFLWKAQYFFITVRWRNLKEKNYQQWIIYCRVNYSFVFFIYYSIQFFISQYIRYLYKCT